MKISAIIPTYNRGDSLKETLDSLRKQTKLPEEVIIVDDSDNDEIENLVEHRKKEFNEKDILLKYIRNEREKSLTIARNIGIEDAIGDIILFLDGDVILDENYIKEILKVYEEHSDALGVQGYIMNMALPVSVLDKIIFYPHREKEKCRVLPSTYITYPHALIKTVSCQWLSGSNQSYKRSVIENFKYDENLKRYSYKEDVDFSYRVYKKYPGSLYITPHAKLIHNKSHEGRLPNKTLIFMQHIYTLYFFYKNIDQTIKNKIIFIWCWIGYLIMNASISIMSFIIRGSKSGLVTVKYTIGAYVTCIRHLKEIKKGDLGFFNRELR